MLVNNISSQMDTKSSLENRLLMIFRALAVIRLFIAIVFLILPRPNIANLGWSQSIVVVEVGLLLIYLVIPGLKNTLGRFYLPIAITWATIIPLLVQNLTLYWEFERLTRPLLSHPTFLVLENTLILSSINQTILVLIVPLIVVAWAYSRKTLFLYCFAIAVFDLAMTALFIQINPTVFLIGFALILFRTLLYGVIGSVINQLVSVELEQQQRLVDANKKLQEYGAIREQLATSRERDRIARELHDTLAHTLSVATVQLEAVNIIWEQQPQKAREMVMKSAAMMRDGLGETRRALQALRAGSLDNENLVSAITNLAEALMTRYTLSIEVRASSPVSIQNAAVEHGLYRIIQEAMFNAARHSQASHLTIQFEALAQQLTVTVADNGIGFDHDTANNQGHFGLRGMRERAEHIRANLQVVSRAGSGTIIIIRLDGQYGKNSNLR
jgi:signal transduction histidine kinase